MLHREFVGVTNRHAVTIEISWCLAVLGQLFVDLTRRERRRLAAFEPLANQLATVRIYPRLSAAHPFTFLPYKRAWEFGHAPRSARSKLPVKNHRPAICYMG